MNIKANVPLYYIVLDLLCSMINNYEKTFSKDSYTINDTFYNFFSNFQNILIFHVFHVKIKTNLQYQMGQTGLATVCC